MHRVLRTVLSALLPLAVITPAPAGAQDYCWDDVFPPEAAGGGPSIPMPPSAYPETKLRFGSRVFFAAYRRGIGRELFYTNRVCGEYEFHHPTKGWDDVAPGVASSEPREFTLFCGQMFFVADGEVAGRPEKGLLYTISSATDVRAGNWPVVLDGELFSDVRDLTLHNGELWFTAEGYSDKHGDVSRFAWRIYSPQPDQCVTAMVHLERPDPDRVPDVRELESSGPRMGLTVKWNDTNPSNDDREIWLSGGTPANSDKVVDTLFGPSELTYEPLLDQLFFTSFIGLRTYLWRSDLTGDPAGTIVLRHPSSGGTPGSVYEPSNPVELFAADGYVYCRAESPAEGCELWRSGGTVASTELTSDLTPGFAGSNPFDFRYLDGDVVFLVRSDVPALDGIYQSPVVDPAGTQVIRLIPDPSDLTLLEGDELLYFAGDFPGDDGHEIWLSDGTPAGTHTVKDANEGIASSHPKFFVRLGNTVLMTGVEKDLGTEIFMVKYALYGL